MSSPVTLENSTPEVATAADSLTLAVAQTAPRLGAITANLHEIERVTAEAHSRGAHLVLFPELALTGYSLQDAVSAVALRADSSRLRQIAGLSRDIALVLGFVEEGANGAFHNSALIALAGRVAAIHRKRHLPTYHLFDEGRFFQPGAGIATFELGGWRLGVLICEEAWYPQTVHEVVMRGAEGLLVLSNGPGRGIQRPEKWQTQESWRDLLRYYARTYAVPVFLANRTGIEEGLFFGGCSAIVSPTGRILSEGPLFDEALLVGELSRAALRRARMRNPGRPLEPPPDFDALLFPPAAQFPSPSSDART